MTQESRLSKEAVNCGRWNRCEFSIFERYVHYIVLNVQESSYRYKMWMLLISYTQTVENLVDNTQEKLYAVWRMEYREFFGDYWMKDTPVPISNTVVKLQTAEDT